jgi:glycosyltransferase involved in cell wall biosynthesis
MPHGVDLEVFRSGLLSGVIVRHRVRGRVLLCVSPVDLRSGHDVLITAFAHTVGQRGDWSLVIASAGSNSRRLRAHAERLGVGDRVHLLPAPSADELPGLLSCATLTALPGLEDEARGDQSVSLFNSDIGTVVGVSGTILRTTTGGVSVGVQNISTEIPSGYSLSQNYPNPFNPFTNLEFGISKLGFVSLKIYDLLGKEVAVLVNERLAPGSYSYQFSTVNYQLASGVYFYRLSAGEFTDTKRMMLLK